MKSEDFRHILEKIQNAGDELDLSHCELNLLTREQILDFHGAMGKVAPRIRHINLSHNDFAYFPNINIWPGDETDDSIKLSAMKNFIGSFAEFFNSFGQCTNLKKISLTNCMFGHPIRNGKKWGTTGEYSIWREQLLLKLPLSLEEIDLSQNHLDKELFDEVKALNKPEEKRNADNTIFFVYALQRFGNLKSLHVEGNNLKPYQLSDLFITLANLPTKEKYQILVEDYAPALESMYKTLLQKNTITNEHLKLVFNTIYTATENTDLPLDKRLALYHIGKRFSNLLPEAKAEKCFPYYATTMLDARNLLVTMPDTARHEFNRDLTKYLHSDATDGRQDPWRDLMLNYHWKKCSQTNADWVGNYTKQHGMRFFTTNSKDLTSDDNLISVASPKPTR